MLKERLEPLPSLETTEYESKFLNLFELSEEDEARLRQLIQKHGGLVRIFVHPEYENYTLYEKNPEVIERLKRMTEAIKHVLASKDENKPPIIILRDYGEMTDVMGVFKPVPYPEVVRKVKKRIKNDYGNAVNMGEGTLAHNAYVVPTSFASPLPMIDGLETDEDAWGRLNNMLENLGVKKILIAGAELNVGQSENVENLSGCLGTAIQELRKKFEIELSTLTHPEGRTQLRKRKINI